MKQGRPEPIESLLQRLEAHWDSSAQLPARKLLRIELIRDLARSLHTLHSELLATGDECEAREINDREKFLSERFMELGLESPTLPLRQVYARSSAGLCNRNVPVTPPTQGPIPAEKLSRPDRRWEAAMVNEACAQGWNAWTLDCWIDISEVESWGKAFTKQLWPKGIILFVESTAFEASLWKGKWYLLLDQTILEPQKLKFDEGAQRPLWTRLPTTRPATGP
jgi:hypothetical protein